jgi:hypothetical protein
MNDPTDIRSSTYLDRCDIREELRHVVRLGRREWCGYHKHLVYEHTERPDIARTIMPQVKYKFRGQILYAIV